MSQFRIGLDLYGGDNAPTSIYEGAIFAIENKFITNEKIVLLGEKKDFPNSDKYSQIEFINAENLIDNSTKPTDALKLKNSSIYRGCECLKNKELDAFVSAGNTGALLANGTFVAGRLKGIKRPALALAFPRKGNNPGILVDAGANSEVKAEHFYDFALEGIAYAKFMGIEKPRVGILNIGSEEEKGTSLVKDASYLLKEKKVNYIGYVEARDIFDLNYDVLLTDGFTGNNVLKTIEGTAYYILGELKHSIKKGGLFTKIGALLLKSSLYSLKSKLDYRQYGGTFFLGVNGILVKAHGSSDKEAIAHAIYVAAKALKDNLIGNIDISKED